MADKQYKRQLILHSNAYPQTHTLTVKVQTAALPIEKRKIASGDLIGLFLMSEDDEYQDKIVYLPLP